METLKRLEKNITAKLDLLEFTNGKTPAIISSGDMVVMERQARILEKKIQEVQDLEVEIQEAKFQTGSSSEDVSEWTEKLEQRLKYESQFGQKQSEAQQPKYATPTKPNIKLHKIEMTKFNGTYEDWLRFWNQFEAEIHAADIPAITKFTYLKESVDPKVRVYIDGLPFTTEGYERARNVLKSRYGKTSEIINAYVQNIMGLSTIHGSQPAKIHDFYQKLMSNVQSLETLGKLKDVNGYVRTTIDKLEGIRGDLLRTDDDWQKWEFPQLVEALRKWTERNPVKPQGDKPLSFNQQTTPKRGRNFQTRQQDEPRAARTCTYCDEKDHRAVDCAKIKRVDERKKILSQKRLCFNCTGSDHRASECKSKSVCKTCQRRHHSSICDQLKQSGMMTATGEGRERVTFPLVVVKIDGIKCRALLDTGAGGSYASSALVKALKARPSRTEYKRVEMMLSSTTKAFSVYETKIESVDGQFQLATEVTKVDRENLLTLNNPKYKETIAKYKHLEGVEMIDNDEKTELPVHLILGASEYAQIKTHSKPRVGQPGEAVAELTKFGWTILSPGTELEPALNLFTAVRTVATDYENLCKLDVLGLEDFETGSQDAVHREFQEQLTRSPEGWYETGLPWKGNHPPLPNHRCGSLKRLDNLLKKLKRQDNLQKYDQIIQDQLEQGIVEPANEVTDGKEFYIPHKAVIRESAETTKMRIVYDASAKDSNSSPSLNDCLETGPPLQNQLWSVLVRNRFHPVAIAGDLKQAFLQVRIREADRDALRFHWLRDLDSQEVQVLPFTRALFGLSPSPFLLAGVIKEHLQRCKSTYPAEVIEEIDRSLYVDDLISGGDTVEQAMEIKTTAIQVFDEARFALHKWHSNVKSLEQQTTPTSSEDPSFAKQQLGVIEGETKLLGLSWDKKEDTLQISFPTTQQLIANFFANIVSTFLKLSDKKEENMVPGSILTKSFEDATVPELKRWLKCRNAPTSGLKNDLVEK